MAKRRVSAKQRLELVEEALARFDRSDRSEDAYARFVGDIDLALTSKLEPRGGADDGAE